MKLDTKKHIILIALLIAFTTAFTQEYKPSYFSEKEFLEDIRFLKEKATAIHPKFLDKEFAVQWNKQCASLINNTADSLTFNECYVKFASLLADLQDGHSNFLFAYTERLKYMKNGGVTMPFTISIKGNKVFVAKDFVNPNETNFSGSEIISINGISSDSILNRLQLFYGAKRISIVNNTIEKYFGAYFWTVFGGFSQYDIEILKNRESIRLTLNPITNSEYFTLRDQLYPKQKEKKYELLFFDNNDFAYLKIKSFANKKLLAEFGKEAFDTIKTLKCKNLLIDIRDNFGGTSNSVDTLLSYLTNKPYRQYASIGLRTSEDVKTKYKKKSPELYAKIKDSTDTIFYYKDSMLNKEPVFRDALFSGNIFVLINEKTYSAAATFTGVIKQYELGKIVGASETGGTIEYYGDFLFFSLPNTKMDFFISPKTFVQYGGNDLNKGVLPDIIISEDKNIKTQIEELKKNTSNTY